MERNNIEELSSRFLLNQNIIDVYGEINNDMARNVIAQLQYLDFRFKEQKTPRNERLITMQINSPGGSVSAGLAIYDTMNYVSSKVCTIAIGTAASMGAFLLSSGTKGYRKALPHAEILIHQPWGSVQGQASDIVIAAEHIQKMKLTLNQILSQNTGQTLERICENTERDYIMSASEAKEYGLIDEVIKITAK